jgi:uncharacterized protein GlcG (DUF336 family)
MNTEAIGEFCRPGGTSPGLEATNGGLVVFAGGIPINDSRGNLLGAVGVSGGSVEQDFEVATAAVDSAYRVGDPEWSSAVLEDQRSSLQAYAARS